MVGRKVNAHSSSSQDLECVASTSNETPETQLSRSSQIPEFNNELSQCAALCGNYILVINSQKVPVKKSELAKLVPKHLSRKMDDILRFTEAKLKDAFGYCLKEIDKKRGLYILVNGLDTSDILGEITPSLPSQKRKSAAVLLRTNILIVILMRNGVASEGMLKEFLKKFNLDLESKDSHPSLGNVNKLFYQDMVRQGYLTASAGDESTGMEFRWGPRAEAELNKKELLEFVCKVYGDNIRPEMWMNQFNTD